MEGGGEADDGGGGEADDGGGAVAKSIEVTKAERSDAVNINIRRSDGRNFSVQVSRKSSVQSFKSMLAQHCDIPAEKQRLVYRGRILDDERVLCDYGLVEETIVHLFGGFIPIPASNHTSNTVEEGTVVQSGSPSLGTSDTSRIAEFERIMRRLFQNPSLLPETMYRMSNPDSLFFRMLNTPEFHVVFKRNPMFPLIIDNSRIFRVMVEAVIFFEFIREMMRYVDRTGGAPTFDGGPPIQGLELAGMLCSKSSSTPDSNSTSDLVMPNLTVLMIRRFLLLQISETPFNPHLKEILQNLSFLHHFKLVEAMQQLMDLLQNFVFQRGQQQSTSDAGQTGRRTGGVGYETFGLDKVMNMFSELAPNNPNNNAVPEELYARQLAQLKQLGFFYTRANVEALKATAGNLSAAVDFLLK